MREASLGGFWGQLDAEGREQAGRGGGGATMGPVPGLAGGRPWENPHPPEEEAMPMTSPLPTPHSLLVTTSTQGVFYKVSFGRSSQCQLMVG